MLRRTTASIVFRTVVVAVGRHHGSDNHTTRRSIIDLKPAIAAPSGLHATRKTLAPTKFNLDVPGMTPAQFLLCVKQRFEDCATMNPVEMAASMTALLSSGLPQGTDAASKDRAAAASSTMKQLVAAMTTEFQFGKQWCDDWDNKFVRSFYDTLQPTAPGRAATLTGSPSLTFTQHVDIVTLPVLHYNQLLRERDALLNENQMLTIRVAQLQNESDDRHQRLILHEAERATTQRVIQTLQEENRQLRADNAVLRAKVAKLESTVDTLQKELVDTQKELTRVTEGLTLVQKKFDVMDYQVKIAACCHMVDDAFKQSYRDQMQLRGLKRRVPEYFSLRNFFTQDQRDDMEDFEVELWNRFVGLPNRQCLLDEKIQQIWKRILTERNSLSHPNVKKMSFEEVLEGLAILQPQEEDRALHAICVALFSV